MPISTAHNGAVSDRSKLAITFQIDSLQITAETMGGNPLDIGAGPGGPITLASGQTLGVDAGTPFSVGTAGGPGQGVLVFNWVFSATQSGGSMRATGADLYCVNVGVYEGMDATAGMRAETHSASPSNPYIGSTIDGMPGEERHSIGVWSGQFHGNEFDSGIDDAQHGVLQLTSGAATAPFPQRDRFTITGEPVIAHGMPDAIGHFKVFDAALIAGDLKTGAYAIGPNDGFTFSVKIIP